ncbi:MAG: hypothetical protein WBW07_02825 [Azonexus sp.]
MTKITVVFHSGYGHTLRMAQAVAERSQPDLDMARGHAEDASP